MRIELAMGFDIVMRPSCYDQPHSGAKSAPFRSGFHLLEGAELARFGAGYRPTDDPQVFEPVRKNPQESSPARTIKAQPIDF